MTRLFAISIALSTAAIILSTLALIYVLNPFQSQIGKPSFSIENYPYGVEVFSTFTRIILKNNGTATAHNIKVEIIFAWGGQEITEFVPELSPEYTVTLSIPVGSQQIADHRDLFIHVGCNELGYATMSFSFHLS